MSEEDKQRGYELYTEYNVAGLVGHCLEEEKENKNLKNILSKITNYLDNQHDIPIELLINIKNIINGGEDEEWKKKKNQKKND